MAALLSEATPEEDQELRIRSLTLGLVRIMRAQDPGALESLLQIFPLATPEGQSLLRLAESLLHIPDKATQDALIRDQVVSRNWSRTLSRNTPLVVSATVKGMSLAASLASAPGFSLRSLTSAGSAPMIRRAMSRAIHLMGAQFVPGETIGSALRTTNAAAGRGFTFSYDMLCESALTADDAARYLERCEAALEALGHHAGVAGTLHERPSMSLKLSGLHPRFGVAKRARILNELFPTLQRLAVRARHLDISLILNAEDGERLNLALDLFEALCTLPDLAGWDGLGIAVQAYRRNAPEIVDMLIALAKKTERRIMVRLIKGAYWNPEIRHAQNKGLSTFPVYTRKSHTDLSYIACARRLLDAPEQVYPQFGTHNARTIAHLHTIAGPWRPGRYEFQCLYGMADTLAARIIAKDGLNVPCRIYAPVGTYEKLLGYLLRRFVENGAGSSFLNQVATPAVPLESLIACPAARIRERGLDAWVNPAITAPPDLFGPSRRNAAAMEVTDEHGLRTFLAAIDPDAPVPHVTPLTPDLPESPTGQGERTIHNPAERLDRICVVRDADAAILDRALEIAEDGIAIWSQKTPGQRIRALDTAADMLETARFDFVELLVREAGRTVSSAVREWREAVDMLRYGSEHLRGRNHRTQATPLGIVASLTSCNAPLSVFVGQITTALAAGNAVIAKPAEQTSLIAYRATQLLLTAGIPPQTVQMLPGDDALATALVQDPRVDAVKFTGETGFGKILSRLVTDRVGRTGAPVHFVSRTSAQNAMLVDSSALPEQVVRDILTGAFDNAGQNRTSLRILLIQDDCADEILERLRGAMRELSIGNPARLSTDIGPVISSEAQARVEDHIDQLRRAGRQIWSLEPREACRNGHFVGPTLIEIGRVADIGTDAPGPVLHIRRFARAEMDGVIDAVNATGYGLTFAVHSRLSTTISRVIARSTAGNIFVNCYRLGTVAGSRPIGGHGLSGTGPKLGGPFTVRRMSARVNEWNAPHNATAGVTPNAARSLVGFLESRDAVSARNIRADISHGLVGLRMSLPTAAGESAHYKMVPIGPVLCAGESWPAILRAVGIVLGTGNTALVLGPDHALEWMARLSAGLQDWIQRVDAGALPDCQAMIIEGGSTLAENAAATISAREGRIVPVYRLDHVRPEWLLSERLVTTNTAAICGDPALMEVE